MLWNFILMGQDILLRKTSFTQYDVFEIRSFCMNQKLFLFISLTNTPVIYNHLFCLNPLSNKYTLGLFPVSDYYE